MAGADRTPNNRRRKLTPRQRAQIREIGRLQRAGRPVYGMAYIAALYGVTKACVTHLCQRRAGKHPWLTKRRL